MSQTSRSSFARLDGWNSPHATAFSNVLRLVLRTQPRSGPFAVGGSVKMRPIRSGFLLVARVPAVSHVLQKPDLCVLADMRFEFPRSYEFPGGDAGVSGHAVGDADALETGRSDKRRILIIDQLGAAMVKTDPSVNANRLHKHLLQRPSMHGLIDVRIEVADVVSGDAGGVQEGVEHAVDGAVAGGGRGWGIAGSGHRV